MKANTLKSLLGILILCSMLNISCNQNSPAPISPTPSTPASPTTNTNTPEGLAVDVSGQWFLDSIIYYTTPTNYYTQKFGYAQQLGIPGAITADHKERLLKDSVTFYQNATGLSTVSHRRRVFNINWTRDMIGDTSNLVKSNSTWVVQILYNRLFIDASDLQGYVRSYTGNNLVLSADTLNIKAHQWYYWHK